MQKTLAYSDCSSRLGHKLHLQIAQQNKAEKKCIKSIAIIRTNAYLIIFGDTNRLFYLLCAWIDHAAKVRRSKNHQPKMFCRFLS